MTTYIKSWTNYIWLAWFAISLPIIVFIDALPHYPSHLYSTPGSPLHVFQTARQGYIDQTNDPIVQFSTPTTSAPGNSWVDLFMKVEFFFSLPTVVYGVYRLGFGGGGGKRLSTSGADELLFLVYALLTAFTTLVCMHDVAWWDDKAYPAEVKRVFWFQTYGPFFVVPALMFVDMASRILGRIRAADAAIAAAAVGGKKRE